PISVLPFLFYPPLSSAVYTLSLHDALPIFGGVAGRHRIGHARRVLDRGHVLHVLCFDPKAGIAHMFDPDAAAAAARMLLDGEQRSEEYTSELQSRENLVCRLLLEKKNNHQV